MELRIQVAFQDGVQVELVASSLDTQAGKVAG
jgi:hypothetical protein